MEVWGPTISGFALKIYKSLNLKIDLWFMGIDLWFMIAIYDLVSNLILLRFKDNFYSW